MFTVQSLASSPQLHGGAALAPSMLGKGRPSMLDTCAGKCGSLKSAWVVPAPSALMVARVAARPQLVAAAAAAVLVAAAAVAASVQQRRRQAAVSPTLAL